MCQVVPNGSRTSQVVSCGSRTCQVMSSGSSSCMSAVSNGGVKDSSCRSRCQVV